MSSPIEELGEAILQLKAALRLKPDLRQGTVTAKTTGPPMVLTVTMDQGTFSGVRCVDSTVVNGDVVWILILPGGTKIAIGDLK